MDDRQDQHFRPAGGPAPFILIIGRDARTGADDPEPHFRRMGLRPMTASAQDVATNDGHALLVEPVSRLQFARLSVFAGRPAPELFARAGPSHAAVMTVGPALPFDSIDASQCLAFVPHTDTDHGHSAETLREFFQMMVLLIDLFDASHLFWSPAALWSDARQFREAVAEMLSSGMPPVLHLVAFGQRDDAAGQMTTRGLGHFCDQEIDAAVPEGWTEAMAVRRLARVALDMILNGAIRGQRHFSGIEHGERMVIEGQAHRVRVSWYRRGDP